MWGWRRRRWRSREGLADGGPRTAEVGGRRTAGAKPSASPSSICMPSNFKSLAAYQRSRALAEELYRVVMQWPAFDRDSVGLQMVRSADSISANIAEAAGRWSAADK